MRKTLILNDDFVICRSDKGDGGWSLHAPGSDDQDIASGDAPYLAQGADRDGPTEADYQGAAERLAPWAAEIIPCDGGYMAFESVDDAATWRRQNMTTYTIATRESMIIALVPDGEDIDAAVQAAAESLGEDEIKCIVEKGLTLTDDEPANRSRIVWNASGGRGGWLMVQTDHGTVIYNYAVR